MRVSLLSVVGFAVTLTACSGSPGPQGEAGPPGPAGVQGVQGEPGAPGADGQLRIYGDGSAGSLTIASNTNWITAPPPEHNLQFEDLTINGGFTLTVTSGTVIRVRGTFTNNGTIAVGQYAQGGLADLDNTNAADAILSPPNPGIAPGVAGSGERAVGASANCDSGRGGMGIGFAGRAAAILNPGPLGGGGGGAATNALFNGFGGNGGGTLVVLAQGAIGNAGTINAVGQNAGTGGGGGGGGIVILASKTSITHSGTINANGGNGGASGASTGAGGGGGGGLVQLIAPAVTSTGGPTSRRSDR